MTKKRSQPSRDVKPPEIDDLQIIDGIGPAIERRLHNIGIYTFAQLAALPAADIAASVADIAGMTTERIIKQNWIGQARNLASKTVETPAHDVPLDVPSAEQSHVASPIREATSVSATISRLTGSATVMTTAGPKVKTRGITGTLHLRDLEIILHHSNNHRTIIPSNQPFKIHVILDFTEVAAPNRQLGYTASIVGKQLSSSTRYNMGKTQGTLIPAGEVVVEVEGTATNPGFYRLEVMVSLTREGTSIPGLLAMIEGGPLHFY